MTVTPATPATPVIVPTKPERQMGREKITPESNWRSKSPQKAQGWERWHGRREAGADRDKWKYVVPPSLRQTPSEREFSTPKKKVPSSAPSRTMRRSMEQIIQVAESSPLCPPPPVPRSKTPFPSSPPVSEHKSEMRHDEEDEIPIKTSYETPWDFAKDYNPLWDILSSTRESCIDFTSFQSPPGKKFYPTPSGSRTSRRNDDNSHVQELSFADYARSSSASPPPRSRAQPPSVSSQKKRQVDAPQNVATNSVSPETIAPSNKLVSETKPKKTIPAPTTAPSLRRSSIVSSETPSTSTGLQTPTKSKKPEVGFCTPPRQPKQKLNFSQNDNSRSDGVGTEQPEQKKPALPKTTTANKSTAPAATSQGGRHFGYNWSGSPYVPRTQCEAKSLLSPKANIFSPSKTTSTSADATVPPSITTNTPFSSPQGKPPRAPCFVPVNRAAVVATPTSAKEVHPAFTKVAVFVPSTEPVTSSDPSFSHSLPWIAPASSPISSSPSLSSSSSSSSSSSPSSSSSSSSSSSVSASPSITRSFTAIISPSSSTKIANSLDGTLLSTSSPLLNSPSSQVFSQHLEVSLTSSPCETLSISLTTPTSGPRPLILCPSALPSRESQTTSSIALSSSHVLPCHVPAELVAVPSLRIHLAPLCSLEGLNAFLTVFVAVLCAFVLAGNF